MNRLEVGTMCREFRNTRLHLTLEGMQELTGFSSGTISAFEHGKSSNMLILLSYYKLCKDEKNKDYFIHRLFDLL